MRRSVIRGVLQKQTLVPLPVRPHPLLGRLANEGFELALQRLRCDESVGVPIVCLRNKDRFDANAEADVRAAEGDAGVERRPGRTRETGRKQIRARGMAEEGLRRAAVVAKVGEERRTGAVLDGS